MYTSDLYAMIAKYFEVEFNYNDYIIDQANNPFVTITFSSPEQCESYGRYITPNHGIHSSLYNSLTCHILCASLELLHTHNSKVKTIPVTNEYGFCNSFTIGNLTIIVSIIADPVDAKFLFTHIKNKLEIYYQETKEEL